MLDHCMREVLWELPKWIPGCDASTQVDLKRGGAVVRAQAGAVRVVVVVQEHERLGRRGRIELSQADWSRVLAYGRADLLLYGVERPSEDPPGLEAFVLGDLSVLRNEYYSGRLRWVEKDGTWSVRLANLPQDFVVGSSDG